MNDTTAGFATVTPGDNLKKLTGSDALKRQGDFVHAGQKMAVENGFKCVSKKWYDKTMSYEQGLEALEAEKANTQDLVVPLAAMTPAVDASGKFCLRHADGREFRPTVYAVGQIGGIAGTGKWYAQTLCESTPECERDAVDAEALVVAVRNGFRRRPADKDYLWRTRADGTLRAVLSTQYAAVDNRWYVETLSRLIPGGRLSHWRGDADTIYGNVLIPDTVREEQDSDYGGMLSVGNSEIGERRVSSLPSVFRAICMNGCIWGREVGKGIKRIHRGTIDLGELYQSIKLNLEAQIPLLPSGIDKLLHTQRFVWDAPSIVPLFAQVAMDGKLTKKQATSLLTAYNVERKETPDYARSLFAVANAVTRAGQSFEPSVWVKFDQLGGLLADFDDNEWNSLSSRARALSVKDAESAFLSA